MHASAVVAREPNGDFRIESSLSPVPPELCASPVLLVAGQVKAGGVSADRWFAAWIPKQ
jgi:hypothetical protein